MTTDETRPAGNRSWWPVVAAVGLVIASIVAVVLFTTGDDAAAPVDSAPSTAASTTTASTPETTTGATTVPADDVSVAFVDGCVEVDAGGETATGCFDTDDTAELAGRTLLARLGQLYEVTFAAADDPSVAPVEPGAVCRGDEIIDVVAVGEIAEVVICSDDAGLVALLGAAPEQRSTWFTLPSGQNPTGSELGTATPVDDLPGALRFAAPMQGSAGCTMLLPADRSTWKEACLGGPLSPSTAVTLIGNDVVEVSIDDTGLITNATPLDGFSPANGCTVDDARALLSLMPATSIATALTCLDDKASAATAAVLLQFGPPDGLLWTALRDPDWVITDQGTGIETFDLPIPARSTWSTWPGDTTGRPSAYWGDAIATVGVQPDVATLADAILATLGPLAFDPEFPLNERLVAVEPDGLPLIVVQVDIGGDDSLAGAAIFTWIEQVFDDSGPIGWQPDQVIVSDICARGTTVPDQELCV
jgi:hypothetical protein